MSVLDEQADAPKPRAVQEGTEPSAPRWTGLRRRLRRLFDSPDGGVPQSNRVLKAITTAGRFAFKAAGEAYSVALGLAMIWFGIVTHALTQKDVNLAVLAPHIQYNFARSFNGADAEIGDMHLIWTERRRSLTFTAQDVRITSRDGEPIAEIERLRSEFPLTSLLLGQVKAAALDVQGGALTLRRDTDGELSAYLGPPDASGRFDALTTFNPSDVGPANPENPDVPQETDRSLRAIHIEDTDIYLFDEASDWSAALKDGQVSLVTPKNGRFRGSASGRLESAAGEASLVKMSLAPAADAATGALDLIINAQDFIPAQFAARDGMSAVLKDIAAPLDVDARVRFRASNQFESLKADVKAGAGKIGTLNVSQFETKLTYEKNKNSITFERFMLRSDRHDLDATGTVSPVADEPFGVVDINLELGKSIVDLGQSFPERSVLDSGQINARADIRARRFDVRDAVFTEGNAQLTAIGLIDFDVITRKVEELRMSIAVDGSLSKDRLLSRWPLTLSPDARSWVETAVEQGDISALQAKVDISPEAIATKTLTNNALDVTVNVHDARVKFHPEMSAISVPLAKLSVAGNSLRAELPSGAPVADLAGVSLSKLGVTIPAFKPKGVPYDITASGYGTAADMLRIAAQPPLSLLEDSALKPETVLGDGKFDLSLSLLFGGGPVEAVPQFNFDGAFKGISAPVGVGTHTLNAADLTLAASPQGVRLSGPARLGEFPGQLTISQPINAPDQREFAFTGTVARADLQTTGLGLRRYFGGGVGYTFKAKGDGRSFADAQVELDLAPAELTLGTYWSKAVGAPGTAQGTVNYNAQSGLSISNLSVAAQGFELAGNLRLAPDYRLLGLNLQKVKVENFIDGGLTIAPTEEGVLSITATGQFLDATDWVSDVFGTETNEGLGVPIRLTAAIDTLLLAPQYAITDANAVFFHNGVSMQQARLKGQTVDGTAFAEVTVSETARKRNIDVRLPDASKAARAFFGLENITGGTLDIIGTLPAVGDDGALQAVATLKDFKLIKAPALAQILSLASLKGLADLFGGEGLSFKQFEVPFTMEKGYLRIRGARASGAAIGLTGNGDIRLDVGAVDMDGVLVPAYGVNSMLGDVPLVGDIVVGKKGEGMFALNYSVGGTFDKLSVKINPLSALTPGFLRGIFQPERSKLPEMERDMTPKADE